MSAIPLTPKIQCCYFHQTLSFDGNLTGVWRVWIFKSRLDPGTHRNWRKADPPEGVQFGEASADGWRERRA